MRRRAVVVKARALAIACTLAPAIANANGRPPMTNGVHFRPGDNQAIYVASTFGLLVSSDGCRFSWLCEDNIGYGGEFDPAYAVSSTGAIFATTFHGLRVSRDGGCSFTTATAQLPPSDPGNISVLYLDAIDIGPTGEVWVATAETGSGNAIYRSTDDGLTFTARGALPATMAFKSVKVAPSDPLRVYVTGFQVSGDTTPPSAHLFRSDDGGASWTEQAITNLVLGSSPVIMLGAIDAANADILYLRSVGANPPSGDRLYRSADGGGAFTEVLSIMDPISDVVVRDAHTVIVASQNAGGFQSIDGGATFTSLPGSPRLACLAQRGDGALFGCAANYDPDHMALAMSTDAVRWTPALRFEYISGPLSCAPGTVQYGTCDNQLWRTFAQQLGVMPSQCSSGPAGVPDGPAVDAAPLHKAGGCCDTGAADSTLWGLVVAGTLLLRTRRPRPGRR